jgi:hypothetical protein
MEVKGFVDVPGLPEGWELVSFRTPKKDEYSLSDGFPYLWTCDGIYSRPIIRKVPKKLKLEEGKYYRQICGDVVGPVELDEIGSYKNFPYRVPLNGGFYIYYSQDGVRVCENIRDTQNLVEEVPAPEPKYRAFRMIEFAHHKDEWIERKDGKGEFKSTGYNETGIFTSDRFIEYEDLLEYKFGDGSVCGVLTDS